MKTKCVNYSNTQKNYQKLSQVPEGSDLLRWFKM